MPRKKLPAARERQERQSRVSQLVDLVCHSNQREASRLTGISQAHISRVISGVRPATDDFIDAFSRLPGINVRWLWEGIGEPLVPPNAGTLPVATVILPGPPADYPSLCSGERYPVPAAWDFPTRYWLRLTDEAKLVRTLSPQFVAGDMLLVETDRDQLDRPDIITGKLCLITVASHAGTTFEFTTLTVESSTIRAEVCDEHFHERAAFAVAESRKLRLEYASRRKGPIIERARKTAFTPPHPATQEARGSKADQVEITQAGSLGTLVLDSTEQIVGLVLMLQRPLPLFRATVKNQGSSV
jgi:hypothetical protein